MANYYVAAQHKYRTGNEQEKYVDSGMHREDNQFRQIAQLFGGQGWKLSRQLNGKCTWELCPDLNAVFLRRIRVGGNV